MASFRLFSNCRQILINNNNKSPIYKIINQQFFSSKPPVSTNPDEPAKKKKTIPIPKITLLAPDENVQVTSLEEAQKLAKRRDLKLVKIIDLDTKTQRPIYKLMTGTEYHAEDLKQREMRKEKKNEAIKGEKLLLINSKISEHDLESRMKNILKWINKKYEIRVVVSGDNVDSCVCIKYNFIYDCIFF